MFFAVVSHEEKHNLLNFACSQEKEDREEKRKSAKKEFKELLKDTEEIDRHSHWSDVKKLIQDDYRSDSGSLLFYFSAFISALLFSVFYPFLQFFATKGKFFSAYYFSKVHLHHFSKIKSHKEVTKQLEKNQGFSYNFCLMIEGSGSGSVPLTNEYGSRSLKNMRIRIRNTASLLYLYLSLLTFL